MRRARSKRTPAPARAVDLMLDSGAFSAWRKGEAISLADYAKFLERNRGLLYSYVNLDVIPGRPGRPASVTEVDEAARASHANLLALRRRGLAPIPVFHHGEAFDWLRKILDSGAEYVSLGGTVGKASSVRSDFFKKSFQIIEAHGRPVRVHGLGVTAFDLLERFDWFTADSTTWTMVAANGSVLVPSAGRDGGFDYLNLKPIKVTAQGGRRALGAMGDASARHVRAFLAEIGVREEDAAVEQYFRHFTNIHCLLRVAEKLGVNLVFATWLRDNSGVKRALTDAGVRRRLMSYYEVQHAEPRLAEYVEHGFFRNTTRKFQ